MNLVLAETIITIYGIPVDFVASMTLGWKMGKGLCLTSGFVLTLTGKQWLRSSKRSGQSTAAGHMGQNSSTHVARSVEAIFPLILFK